MINDSLATLRHQLQPNSARLSFSEMSGVCVTRVVKREQSLRKSINLMVPLKEQYLLQSKTGQSKYIFQEDIQISAHINKR